jgi:hypothetical protein
MLSNQAARDAKIDLSSCLYIDNNLIVTLIVVDSGYLLRDCGGIVQNINNKRKTIL